jgi:hypothetical protein
VRSSRADRELALFTIGPVGSWSRPVQSRYDEKLELFYMSIADTMPIANMLKDPGVRLPETVLPGPPGDDLDLQIEGVTRSTRTLEEALRGGRDHQLESTTRHQLESNQTREEPRTLHFWALVVEMGESRIPIRDFSTCRPVSPPLNIPGRIFGQWSLRVAAVHRGYGQNCGHLQPCQRRPIAPV